MTTTNNTIIRNDYDLLDALETQTYTASGFDITPENGEQVVKLIANPHYVAGSKEPEKKYPFKCNLYNPRRNDSRRTWNERKGEYVNGLWDDQQAPDAIVKPACIQLFFQRADGGRFTAYLANYVDRNGDAAWNKFVDAICDQTQNETACMNITQVLAYLVNHEFKVYAYNNPKYKDKQVCYTQKDYLYWEAQELDRIRKAQAAEKRAEQARQRKAKREIEASAHQMADEIEREAEAGEKLPWA